MFVIGTAGHVDHGKSALVEALTGIDPDRLHEEKARGMTIDLGFAWLTLPSGREVSIVDVPGHERFIKNMLAGAGGIDLVLLVVAADDGVMPQTREHLAIVDLLGVTRGVVALTKCDLVDRDWLEIVEADLRDFLAGTALSDAPIARCSAVSREGLEGLLETLDRAVESLPPKRDIGRPRLPIDRVFTIAGFGTVVTGTLIDGSLRVGDEVEVMPGGARGRIRGLQSHRVPVERALPGTRVAVNIAGIASDALRRGQVLSLPGAVQATTSVDVRLRAAAGATGRVRHGASLMLHSGADEVRVRVRLLDADSVESGGDAWAQLTLSAPAALAAGDRCVLRSPEETLAGGLIVDAAPRRRRRADVAGLDRMEAMLTASPRDALLEAVSRRPFATLPEIARAVAFDADTVSATLDELVFAGTLTRTSGTLDARYVTTPEARAAVDAAIAALSEFHDSNHLRAGMPLGEFRARVGIPADAVDLVVASSGALVMRDGLIALVSFQPAPSAAEEATLAAYLAALPDGVANSTLPAELRAYAVQHGLMVDTGNGVVFAADTFDALSARITNHIEASGPITLAAARDLLGTGRKQAQAMLEELDRRGVTRRTGDTRVLRQPSRTADNDAGG